MVAVGTLTTGVVTLAATSDVARVVIQIVVLLSGFVLWAPVLTELPGAQPLSAFGRGGYLIVQSIVPSFLSVIWIFARRSLYSSYDHHGTVLGHVAGPRPAAGGLSGQAVHDRRALDRGLHPA